MIYTYGLSLPGAYHIKNNIVRQDYHKIIQHKNMAIPVTAE